MKSVNFTFFILYKIFLQFIKSSIIFTEQNNLL